VLVVEGGNELVPTSMTFRVVGVAADDVALDTVVDVRIPVSCRPPRYADVAGKLVV
jgi:hypothetical protein